MPAPMEPTEIIAAINAYVGSDKSKAKEFAKELRSGARDVAQSLINIGGSQKQGELGGEMTTLKQQVADLTEQLEAKDTEIADIRAKQPDVKAIEDRLKAAHEKALAKERERAEKAEGGATKLVTQVALDKAIARLITPNEQGMRADREYAELIAAERLRPYIVPKPDGVVGVKQIGDDGEYDGDTLDAKIDALVRDFRPQIPATFMLSNADSGAGVRNGGNGSTSGLKTVEQIKKEKQQSPAFAGL